MLSVTNKPIMLSTIMLNVVMLIVEAPIKLVDLLLHVCQNHFDVGFTKLKKSNRKESTVNRALGGSTYPG
jgi:hypothetical protein